MIDKPDPAKDAARADAPGVKRPHATLDLKATEVKPPQTTEAAASSASAASASTEGAKPAASAAAASVPQPDTKAAKGTGGDEVPKKDGTPRKAAPETDRATADAVSGIGPAPQRGGGFLSHILAGLIGGGLVFAANTYTGLKQVQVPVASSDVTAQLEARVAALETAPRDSENVANLATKVADNDARLQKLGELEKSVADLRDAQGALQTETKALGDSLQKSDTAAVGARVSKLEEQLALIAAAAPGPEGQTPQLAAITGKISDLEGGLNNQIAALRKMLPSEDRINSTAESSEAAKAATSRLDRELNQLRTDQARATQGLESGKADAARLSAAIDAMKDETAKLSSAVGELRSSLDTQLKGVSKPADVSAAVAPVAGKVAALEQSVATVVKSEESRKENAERIVLSLELQNLKRALDRGQGYAAELAEVTKAAQGKLDLSALERFKDTGVATLPSLKAEFRPVMNAVIDAGTEPADGSVIDRLLAGAKSVVRVRRVDPEAGDSSAEAVVARIESALNDDRLGDVISEAKTLPERAQGSIRDWLEKVSARHSVDVAIAAVEEQLKASLAGAPAPQPAAQSN